MKPTPSTFNAITIGAPCGVSTTLAMNGTVPFLTNSEEIPQGRVAAGGGRQAEESTTEAKDLERSCPHPQWWRRWKWWTEGWGYEDGYQGSGGGVTRQEG